MEIYKRGMWLLAIILLLIHLGCFKGGGSSSKKSITPPETSPGKKTFKSGDGVPGYVLSFPSGSRADVRVEGSFLDGVWTVMFSRALKAPSVLEDADFSGLDSGGLYYFAIANLENAGGSVLTMTPQDTTEWSLGKEGTSAKLIALKATPSFPSDFVGNSIVTTPLANAFGVSSVTLKALYDDENLYILATWTDGKGTKSVNKGRWSFDGKTWTQSPEDEDRLIMMWDMGAPNPDGARCATMCHLEDRPKPRMRTTAGSVDIWQWKGARTNPVGFADDMHFISASSFDGTLATIINDKGKATYQENINIEKNEPAYMATTDPGANASFLFLGLKQSDRAIPFDQKGHKSGDFLSGFILSFPSGSRADVRAEGFYKDGVWTVMFSRALDTSSDSEDADFSGLDSGQVYSFAVANLENAEGSVLTMTPQDTTEWSLGKEGTSAQLIALKTTPSSPSDFVGGSIVTTPQPNAFGVSSVTLKALYDDENLYILATWTDGKGTKSVNKGRWSFDGKTWTQSPEDEDRLIMMWDMGAPNPDGARCATMCHLEDRPKPRMRTTAGSVDIWQWKSARTNPVGFADDMHFISASSFDDTLATIINDKGKATYQDNINKEGNAPAYQAVSGPTEEVDFLFYLPEQIKASTVFVPSVPKEEPPPDGDGGNGNGGNGGIKKISFHAHILPILSANCSCHRGGNSSGGLRLDSYDTLILGGNNNNTNPEIVPKNATKSLIYQKVSMPKPPVGERMPQGGPYLSIEDQLKIKNWIDQGAKNN